MTAALEGTDLAVVAVLVGVVAFLVYRLLRRSPLTRRMRVGVFVERDPFNEPDEENGSIPDDAPTMVLPPRDPRLGPDD